MLSQVEELNSNVGCRLDDVSGDDGTSGGQFCHQVLGVQRKSANGGVEAMEWHVVVASVLRCSVARVEVLILPAGDVLLLLVVSCCHGLIFRGFIALLYYSV